MHNDDTVMKVLSFMKENQERRKAKGKSKKKKGARRTGMFTTGLVSVLAGQKVALFRTGRKHAGENFEDLLKKRKTGLKCQGSHKTSQ